MRWTAGVLAVGVFAVAAACPVGAAATEAPQLEAGAPPLAVQRYHLGRQLYQAGRFREAVSEFRTALEVFPRSAKLAFNLARSLERTGELEQAVGYYRQYLNLTPDADDRQSVDRLLVALTKRLDETRPEVEFTSSPEGVDLFVDGGERPVGRTPTRVRLEPGVHLVRAWKEGFDEVRRTIEVESDAPATVAISLSASAARPMRVWGWMATALGAAGLGVALWSSVSSFGANDRYDEALASDDATLDELEDLRGEVERYNTLTWVSASVGGALAATGAALLVLDARGQPAMALSARPGAVALRVRF